MAPDPAAGLVERGVAVRSTSSYKEEDVAGVAGDGGTAAGSRGDDMTATGLGCGGATSVEYKQVTVLFADVVHSMDIAAAVGAERLRGIRAARSAGSRSESSSSHPTASHDL